MREEGRERRGKTTGQRRARARRRRRRERKNAHLRASKSHCSSTQNARVTSPGSADGQRSARHANPSASDSSPACRRSSARASELDRRSSDPCCRCCSPCSSSSSQQSGAAAGGARAAGAGIGADASFAVTEEGEGREEREANGCFPRRGVVLVDWLYRAIRTTGMDYINACDMAYMPSRLPCAWHKDRCRRASRRIERAGSPAATTTTLAALHTLPCPLCAGERRRGQGMTNHM